MRIARVFLSLLASFGRLASFVLNAQEPGDENPLRLDVVLDDSLRSQPQVEVLGNLGGSLKVTSGGLVIEQPPKSEKLEAAGLRLEVDPTKGFSLQVQRDVQSPPKSSSKVAGVFISLGSGDGPRTAIGLVRGTREATALATTNDFSKLVKKYFDIQDLDSPVKAISIVKAGDRIAVSVGPDASVMEEIASLETSLARIDVVDVVATTGTTSKPTGRYLLTHLSFVGDNYINQPPPTDYSFVWWLLKWLVVLGALGAGVVYGINHDLFRKKIF